MGVEQRGSAASLAKFELFSEGEPLFPSAVWERACPANVQNLVFLSKILRAYLHNSLHARMFYAETPTRGFAVVAAPPRYVICGFKFGIRLIAPSSRHQ